MRLTAYTDYSLRVLIYLGLRPDELVTISEIARAYGISERHLTKVVHQLGVAGHIETVRGHGGGMRLARKPTEIGIGDVVRHTELDLGLVDCFRAQHSCTIGPACALSGILGEALEAFLGVLDRHTLADLLAKRAPIANLLNVTQRQIGPAAQRPHRLPGCRRRELFRSSLAD